MLMIITQALVQVIETVHLNIILIEVANPPLANHKGVQLHLHKMLQNLGCL